MTDTVLTIVILLLLVICFVLLSERNYHKRIAATHRKLIDHYEQVGIPIHERYSEAAHDIARQAIDKFSETNELLTKSEAENSALLREVNRLQDELDNKETGG